MSPDGARPDAVIPRPATAGTAVPVGSSRPRRRRRLVLAATGAAVLLLALAPSVVVRAGSAGHRLADAAQAPVEPVTLVLGAGLLPDGSPSPLLADRVARAAELYRLGRTRALLMSGDNSSTDHDEVTAMARAAERLGVPATAVVLDYAGFDTYSSCYRARYVFGVRRAQVVTQAFHLPRAVWLCRSLGIDAVGVEAASGDTGTDAYGYARELPAAAKALVDVARGRLPTFAGPVEHGLDAVTAAG